MRLMTPGFWYAKPGAAAAALAPAALLYDAGRILRNTLAAPRKSAIPVLCAGNLVAGGSGKTPAALALMALIRGAGIAANPCFLTRGYGGTESGPLLVDIKIHDASAMGDEPLLLARAAPVIVAKDRRAGADFAVTQGFDLIVMDDGLQNPALKKDISLVVIDGARGFGNGRMIPAGPLRAPFSTLRDADAFLMIGADEKQTSALLPTDKPLFTAHLETSGNLPPCDKPVIGFCGIAHPEKFKRTLKQAGYSLAGFHGFADHHRFTAAELKKLAADSSARNARLITTEKDLVRLPPAFIAAHSVETIKIALAWQDAAAVVAFLRERLAQ